MWVSGASYRNKAVDLDFHITVVKVPYRGPKYTKLKVLYWNRYYKGYILPSPELVRVLREHDKNWERMELEGCK